jgi:hypothetical protein
MALLNLSHLRFDHRILKFFSVNRSLFLLPQPTRHLLKSSAAQSLDAIRVLPGACQSGNVTSSASPKEHQGPWPRVQIYLQPTHCRQGPAPRALFLLLLALLMLLSLKAPRDNTR